MAIADGVGPDSGDGAGGGPAGQYLQAITQIHEATLSFVPKLIGCMLVLALAGPWMLSTLVDYIRRTIESIPTLVL